MIINKVMGYGLGNIQYDPVTHLINDPRINNEVLSAIQNRDEKYSDTAFSEFLEERVAKLQAHDLFYQYSSDILMAYYGSKIIRNDKKKGFKIADGVIYNAKSADPNTLILVPYSNHDTWIRRHDAIDYAEHSILPYDSLKSRYNPTVNLLPDPLYPYDLFMDTFSGKTLTPNQHVAVGNYRQLELVLLRPEFNEEMKAHAHAKMEEEVVKAGFRTISEFKKYCAPVIPDEIEDFLEMSGLFNYNRVVYQLRPMVMTYWC